MLRIESRGKYGEHVAQALVCAHLNTNKSRNRGTFLQSEYTVNSFEPALASSD